MAEFDKAFVSPDIVRVDDKLYKSVVMAKRFPNNELSIAIYPFGLPSTLGNLMVLINHEDLAEVQKLLGEERQVLPMAWEDDLTTAMRALREIAEYLGVEPPTPEPQEERPEIRSAFIEGEIAAGVWRERNMEFEKIPVSVVVDERWPSDAVYVLRISGKSINRQARDGDLVLCLRAHAAPRPVRAGDWVVARYFLISAIFSDLPLVFSEFQNILLLTPRRPALTAGRLGERGRHGESKRDENREADRGATVALPRICRQVDQDRALDRAG
jgi:hypothetical protein